jgi:hypothetical protein
MSWPGACDAYQSMKTHRTIRMTRAATATAMAAAAFFWCAVARAEKTETYSNLHLRFGVGLVFTAKAREGENAPFSYSTAPGILDGVQLGGHLNEDNALFFEADSLIRLGKTKNLDSEAVSSTEKNDDEIVYGFFTGVGMGRYISQADLYLSGAMGVTYNNVVVGGDGPMLKTQDMGFGFNLMIAKELWISDSWSAGFGAQLLCMLGRSENSNHFNTATVAFGVLATASFN